MVEAFKVMYCIIYLCTFVTWHGAEGHTLTRNYTTRNIASDYKFKTNNAITATRTPSKVTGKWQVGRVSRKQYEIINMLHRKSISFFETESTSTTNNTIHDTNNLSKIRGLIDKNKPHVTVPPQKLLQESFKAVHPRPNDRPLTPSYIEFYYLDESDDRVKRKTSMPKNSRSELKSDEYKVALLRPPFFLFRVNDATCKPTALKYMPSSFHKNMQLTSRNPREIEKSKEKQYNIRHKFATNRVNKKERNHKQNRTENKKLAFLLRDRFTPLVPRTPYDRIKFFEIYDSDTYKPRRLIDNNEMDMINNNNIHSEEIIYLDQVDHNTNNHDGNNGTRYVKKHANYNLKENIDFLSQVDKPSKKSGKSMETIRKTSMELSRPANWSDFPFVAVYIYEPMQVRCESASISPHWLVASATCLYRHYRNRNSDTEGQSAFVTYCGDNWRLPARIAYVKRSFIHPRFQAKDKSRRYFYNIGRPYTDRSCSHSQQLEVTIDNCCQPPEAVATARAVPCVEDCLLCSHSLKQSTLTASSCPCVIQVVNSMVTTCSGWQPVSLMSHQFAADRDGSFATAIGWGLDRYDTRYRSADLPSNSLMQYEGLVYSDSCPGNADYSKVKMLNGESVKNVYCLSLPTYTLEKNDTVHGSLLLIGGKLIALYLQEERYPWGVQSAQYTGIWRLIPWLLDVAREENLETFASDM